MKIICALAFLAVCHGLQYYGSGVGGAGISGGGKSIFQTENGEIVIQNQYGRRVVITRATGLEGQRDVEVIITGTDIPTRRILINEQDVTGGSPYTLKYGLQYGPYGFRPQSSVLRGILQNYQGYLDEGQYQVLLERIYEAVRAGELNRAFYDILRGLEGREFAFEGLAGYECQYGAAGCSSLWDRLIARQVLGSRLSGLGSGYGLGAGSAYRYNLGQGYGFGPYGAGGNLYNGGYGSLGSSGYGFRAILDRLYNQQYGGASGIYGGRFGVYQGQGGYPLVGLGRQIAGY